ALAELDLAAQLQLFRRFVGGIEPAALSELLGRLGVERETVGLFRETVPVEAEPAQIVLDASGEFLCRTAGIGIVQPQQEAAAGLARKQPVQQRTARIADMQPARGARRETDGNRAHAL